MEVEVCIMDDKYSENYKPYSKKHKNTCVSSYLLNMQKMKGWNINES